MGIQTTTSAGLSQEQLKDFPRLEEFFLWSPVIVAFVKELTNNRIKKIYCARKSEKDDIMKNGIMKIYDKF